MIPYPLRTARLSVCMAGWPAIVKGLQESSTACGTPNRITQPHRGKRSLPQCQLHVLGIESLEFLCSKAADLLTVPGAKPPYEPSIFGHSFLPTQKTEKHPEGHQVSSTGESASALWQSAPDLWSRRNRYRSSPIPIRTSPLSARRNPRQGRKVLRLRFHSAFLFFICLAFLSFIPRPDRFFGKGGAPEREISRFLLSSPFPSVPWMEGNIWNTFRTSHEVFHSPF